MKERRGVPPLLASLQQPRYRRLDIFTETHIPSSLNLLPSLAWLLSWFAFLAFAAAATFFCDGGSCFVAGGADVIGVRVSHGEDVEEVVTTRARLKAKAKLRINYNPDPLRLIGALQDRLD